MTHEFTTIIETAFKHHHIKYVLATVVALDGSSYRKPGVQMLIAENGNITGAVSGGCVEKEVLLKAKSVFSTNVPKVITYDGRFRLGCEGILYILIEPFSVTEKVYTLLKRELALRNEFVMQSVYEKEATENALFGSFVQLKDKSSISFRNNFIIKNEFEDSLLLFTQNFSPLNRLLIIGAEHDSISLCKAAALLGWEILVVDSPRDPKELVTFPGAKAIFHLDPEMEYDFTIDTETAVVLMNHNYARDLHFLLTLQKFKPFYIGILGSAKRREKLMNELIEFYPEIDVNFMDTIYSPAGINIGAITPQEIALAILSEIVAVKRNKVVPSLKNEMGSIH